MNEIKLHDVVALLMDLPEQGLQRGNVVTVVEVFQPTPHDPGGYIVEFVAEPGDMYALVDIIDATQLVQLRFRRKAA